MDSFEHINNGFNKVFQFGKLSLGIVIPIQNYAQESVPNMLHHLERVKYVEELGFSAVWVRDVPFHVPSFGDAGQTFDPFTYLGFLAGQTSKIALGISSVALPLHHPVHVAKSAATIDQLSNGRLLLGVASGDRPIEYPAMGISFENRAQLFRDSFEYIRKAQENFPIISSDNFGSSKGAIDILPKASGNKIPMLTTGYSMQSMEWNAEHGDGWMNYPRNLDQQKNNILDWRKIIAQNHQYSKPFMQPLYVDLHEDENFKPQGIHLGFRIGSNHLVSYLKILEDIGVNHVAINLRFNTLEIDSTLKRLSEKVLIHFNSNL